MQDTSKPRYVGILRILSIVILCAGASSFVIGSMGWQWQWDTSVMHYMNFLMDHGRTPYRDIVDMNMPGSYFIEGWAIRIFGGGDIGWRLYEFSLLAALTASMIVITKPYDWLAGLFGGTMFALIHGKEGPANAAQREEVMTVLILAGVAFLFTAFRSKKPTLTLPFGFLLGLSASLKPTAAPLGLLLLVMLILSLRREKIAAVPYISFGITGFVAGVLVILGFFWKYHALSAFLAISQRLLPYYASVGNQTIFRLIHGLVPGLAPYPFLLITLALTLKNRDWKNWERQVLFLLICFGALSFVVQRKGFAYHRYPFLAFMLLWMGLEYMRALRMQGWVRGLGIAGTVGLLCTVPLCCELINRVDPKSELTDVLEQDLRRLGGAKLQNQVQCLDMVSGCLGALYRLNLVQSTGFVSDFMLFGPPDSNPSTFYRDLFWQNIHQNPPKVIVLTSARLSAPESFDKIDQWPEFASFLHWEYSQDVTLTGNPQNPPSQGYRIYLLKDRQVPTAPVKTSAP
jgi:hypothetical protein